MATEEKPTVFWDSCIFISWLSGEERVDNSETTGIEEMVFQIDHNKMNLILSTLSRSETLFPKGNEKAQERFLSMLKLSNVQEIEVTPLIAQQAHDIQVDLMSKGNTITAPDAIQLATAMYLEINRFFTFDGTGKKQKLLHLNGHEALGGLEIIRPQPSMYPLGF